MRILVASNDMTFNPALIAAYRAAGHEVHSGVPNFLLGLGEYDVIHLHWPEELVGFGSNSASPAKTEPVLDRIDQWIGRAVLVATVHNLIPHGAQRLDGPEATYFAEFYRRMDVICHFSEYSRMRYAETYPNLSSVPQLVHGLNSFDHLWPLARGTAAARETLSLPADGFVFSVIGSMRKLEEFYLLRQGWAKAQLDQSHLLLATNPPWHAMRLHNRLIDKARHRRWLGAHRNVRTLGGNLDDATLVSVIEASDAVIVPRFGLHLNSGIVPLALTFGTAVIAPDYGVCRERLAMSANSLYTAGDSSELAQALRRQIGRDPVQVRSSNLDLIRSTGGWSNIISSVWPTIEQRGRDMCIAAFIESDAGD
jgi:glycosyltransferase involved in cell wall biosynthesis